MRLSPQWQDNPILAYHIGTWPGCNEPAGDECACTRARGHIGKHVAMVRDAYFADRYANTSGYRRQRRRYRRGWCHWPSRKLTAQMGPSWRLARRAFLALAEGERGDSNPRIAESQSAALTNLATPTVETK